VINKWLADLLVAITSHNIYSLLVAAYSAVLGAFIPSRGSKWVIEAPHVLQAAIEHKVNLGWVVQTYNASQRHCRTSSTRSGCSHCCAYST
jgi:short-chain fatty acids transporter